MRWLCRSTVFWSTPWLLAGRLASGADTVQAPRVQEEPAPAPPLEGSVTLPDGGHVRYAYHFDHNAMRQAVLLGDAVVALGWSGNLMRFALPELRLTAHAARGFPATALAADRAGHVLAGFEDGWVYEVDPGTLALKPVEHLADSVAWVGALPRDSATSPAHVAVTLRSEQPAIWPGMSGDELARFQEQAAPPTLRYAELPGGPPREIHVSVGWKNQDALSPNALAIDRKGRLWLGEDGGEFGGRCVLVEVATGKAKEVCGKGCPDVLGFLATDDGHVFAFGGMQHFWYSGGFVARVDQGRWETVKEWGASSEPAPDSGSVEEVNPRRATPPMPSGPIDAIVEDPGKGFLALSEHALWAADARFANWSKRADLDVRWLPGRRSSVGNTATASTVLLPSGDSPSVLLPTGRDGFVIVTSGLRRHVVFEGQLTTAPTFGIVDIWRSSLGTLFFGQRGGFNPDEALFWRRRNGEWEAVDTTPSSGPERQDDIPSEWYEAAPVLDDSSGIVVHWWDGVCCSADNQGRAWFRVDGLGVEEQGAWAGVDPGTVFQAPDGSVFRSVGSRVLRLQGDTWREEGRDSRTTRGSGLEGPHGRKRIVLGGPLPPWALYDVPQGRLGRTRVDAQGQLVVEGYPDADAMPVLDAVSDGPGHALVTTTLGVFDLDIGGGSASPIRGPEPHPQSACRDARDRLWVAGRGLHVSADGGAHWTVVELPMLGPTPSKRLRPDTDDGNGVILALHDRGVVFLSLR